MFKEEDGQIDARFQEISAQFEQKKEKKLMYDRIKDNINDFDYYAASA